jgi:DNA-binding NtrC family response regulator
MGKNAPRPTVLFSWIGNVDCWVAAQRLIADGTITPDEGNKVLATFEEQKPGDRYIKEGRFLPLAKAQPDAFVAYHILTNHDELQVAPFRTWFQRELSALHPSATVDIHPIDLENPSDYAEVFSRVVPFMEDMRSRYPATQFDFAYYLSPGTSAMSNTWVLLSLTRFPADTYQYGSVSRAPSRVDLPFDMRVDLRPRVALGDGIAGLEDELPKEILGSSKVIRSAKRLAKRYAGFPHNVLLLGESGVGKEVFAEVIHSHSGRKGDLQIVNCAAFTDELFSAEMFGVASKAAFTGAEKGPGHFEIADGGTLFLDEVGELSLVNQAKLLRVLQPPRDTPPTRRRFLPVGGKKELETDVRVIAATNRDLEAMVAQGTFRDDLLHRLSVLTIRVPALAERSGDMAELIDYFVERANAVNHAANNDYRPKQLARASRKVLESHPWRGNLRQLQQIVARALAISPNQAQEVSKEHVEEALSHDARSGATSILGRPLGPPFSLKAVEEELRRHYFHRALADARGNQEQAARLLGFASAQAMASQMKKLSIDASDYKTATEQ